jgi:hypothetical protein
MRCFALLSVYTVCVLDALGVKSAVSLKYVLHSNVQ